MTDKFDKLGLIVICAFTLLLAAVSGLHAQQRQLIWADEFNGASIDRTVWSFDFGTANDNSHYFTDRPENAKIVNGILQVIALKESYQGFNYTAALLKTKQSMSWRYGRIEARIKLPGSNGFVPAFWMLPADDLYGWWPYSGEIDILEHPSNQGTKIYGTVHTGEFNSFTGSGPRGGIAHIPDAEQAFHIYAIEWSPEKMDFFVDDQNYFTFHNLNTGSNAWPFDQPFYAILSMGVGGGWVGDPDVNSIFPAVMEVDYIRVYQNLPDISIYGPDFVTQNSKATPYSAPLISGASYTWVVNGGAKIVSGQGTNSIAVDWGNFSGDVQIEMVVGAESYHAAHAVNVSNNLVKNGGFEKGAKYWNKTGPYPAEANFMLTTSDVYSGNSSIFVDVKTPGVNAWDAQLSQGNISLKAGQQYHASFWAKAEKANAQISAAVINSTNYALYGNKTIQLSTSWTKYGFDFKSPANAIGSFNIDLGGHTGRYYFDEFSLSVPETNVANQVQNADFSAGNASWIFNTFAPAQASGATANGEYAISISNGGANVWDIHLGQTGFAIENGKEYTVSFDAHAAAPRTISALVGMNANPWTVYSGDNIISLSTNKQTYIYTFVMNSPTDNQARLGFDVGTSSEDVYFDNIFLSNGSWPTTVSAQSAGSPISFQLYQNYPNPFNPKTTIKFELPEESYVTLDIFDITGKRVHTLIKSDLGAGVHSLQWDGSDQASGVYFLIITAKNFNQAMKMSLIK